MSKRKGKRGARRKKAASSRPAPAVAGNNALLEAAEVTSSVAPQPLSSGAFLRAEAESEPPPPPSEATAAVETATAREEPAREEPAREEATRPEPTPSTAPAPLVIEEHRASPRVSLSVDIHLSSDSHFFTGLSGDISEGGIFVSTYRPLDIGNEVELELTLPGSAEPFTARGTVRWIREHSADHPRGFGISFDVLADGERERIHDFCARRPPLYYELD